MIPADVATSRPAAGARAAVLGLAIAALAAAGCVPVSPSSRSPTIATVVPTGPGPTATIAATDAGDVPALLVSGPDGLVIVLPGRPNQRLALRLPAGLRQPTAAIGAHGTILLVSAGAGRAAMVVEGVLAGTQVEAAWTAVLPVDAAPDMQAGCVAADGSAAVIGDRLLLLRGGRVVGAHAIPATAGRCQMTDDDAVAYLADVDHALTVWRPPDDTAVVSSTRCDDFGLGGDLLACLAAGAQDVSVGRRVTPLGGRPALDAHAIQQLPGPARQVVLSPDGVWLLLVGSDGAGVTAYRRGADGVFTEAGTFSPGASEALLGVVEP